MTIEIHPLQDKSLKLLTALYADRHLPATPAIVDASNYRYPAIKQILSTLEQYKDQDLVIAFVQENAALISNAKSQLTAQKDLSIEEQKTTDQNSIPKEFSSPFGSGIEFVSAYDCLKALPFKEIEEALSRELSKLCKEHLFLKIESSQVDQRNVELKVRIKPKEYISTWNDLAQAGAAAQNEPDTNQP